MASELVELGLEGIDFVTDKYHDAIYDGLGKTGQWISTRRGRIRSGSRQRATSHEIPGKPPSPTFPEPTKMQNNRNSRSERPKRNSCDRDNYYSDEDRGRRDGRRDRERERESDSSYYGEREKVEEWARRSQGPHSPPPQITVDKSNDDSHIYPPPPQPMQPPYPTSGQLLPMPPDAPYPFQRSRSDNQMDPRSRSLIPRNDYDTRGRGLITRSRSANYGRARSRSWSRERERERSLDRGYRRRSGRGERDFDNPHHNSRHFNHVTAGLAGALAGGYLGREVSKGDMAATVAGALVGALGAGVAEREWERHKGNHRREDEKWDMGYGRR